MARWVLGWAWMGVCLGMGPACSTAETATRTTDAGGAAGAAGVPPWATGTTCHALADRGSRLVDDSSGPGERLPRLVLSSADRSRVTIVYQQLSNLGQVEFDAWGDWPAAPLGPTHDLLKGAGMFRVAPSSGDHFALLAERLRVDVALATEVSPGEPASALLSLGDAYDQPEFLASGDADHFWAYRKNSSGSGVVTGRTPDGATDPGCHPDNISAAVRTGGHYLVAYATNRDFDTCVPQDAGDLGHVEIAVVPDAGEPSLAWQWQEPGFFGPKAMIPRSDGVWLVLQQFTMFAPGAVLVARLDPDGKALSAPRMFIESGMMSGELAADRVADDLALAWVEPTTERAIHVALYNQDSVDAPHVEFVIHPVPSERPATYIRLLGSSDGQHLMLAWDADEVSGRTLVVTRRLDCVAPD